MYLLLVEHSADSDYQRRSDPLVFESGRGTPDGGTLKGIDLISLAPLVLVSSSFSQREARLLAVAGPLVFNNSSAAGLAIG